MEIFWRLILGHLLADYTLQTDFIADWKKRNVSGLFVHSVLHLAAYYFLTFPALPQVWVRIAGLELTGFVCILLLFILHFIEDAWRVWAINKNNYSDNTLFYIYDQLVHYALLFLLSPRVQGSNFGIVNYPAIDGILSLSQNALLPNWKQFFAITLQETWVFGGILFVILTQFSTVTIYFLEKDFYQKKFPEQMEKYLAIGERSVLFFCLLLPGKLGFIFGAIWIARALYYARKKSCTSTWISPAFGYTIATLCAMALK